MSNTNYNIPRSGNIRVLLELLVKYNYKHCKLLSQELSPNLDRYDLAWSVAQAQKLSTATILGFAMSTANYAKVRKNGHSMDAFELITSPVLVKQGLVATFSEIPLFVSPKIPDDTIVFLDTAFCGYRSKIVGGVSASKNPDTSVDTRKEDTVCTEGHTVLDRQVFRVNRQSTKNLVLNLPLLIQEMKFMLADKGKPVRITGWLPEQDGKDAEIIFDKELTDWGLLSALRKYVGRHTGEPRALFGEAKTISFDQVKRQNPYLEGVDGSLGSECSRCGGSKNIGFTTTIRCPACV